MYELIDCTQFLNRMLHVWYRLSQKKSVYVFYKLIFEFQVKLKRIDEHILNDRHVTLNRSKQEGVKSSNKYWYCMHVIWNVIYVTERRLLMIFILYLIVKFIIKQEYLDKIMNLFCSTNLGKYSVHEDFWLFV